MMNNDFKEYISFIEAVDRKVEALTGEHKKYMKCGAGCDLCCVAFSVFPVEFYFIKNKMESEGVLIPKDGGNTAKDVSGCALLRNHLCSIYSCRPYICRTHGLPLVNMNEDGDEWELSFCELNFTDADDNYFDMDNVLEQDELNSTLYMINKRFLQKHPELNLDEKTLIPLSNLID